MSSILEVRRIQTERRLDELQSRLNKADQLCDNKACVYATGSFARGEAHEWSDLDLFIVGKDIEGRRELTRLNEICIKAELIEATHEKGIPEFSGDGRYLEHYTSFQLRDSLGKPEDDSTNTFTARLLLLLESRPLLGVGIYQGVIDEVVRAYWQDYEDHSSDFIPAFLANDILRLWRTFCVNYEARTTTVPEIEKAKRKLKNYKLKFSRLLTCYSALLYLLSLHSQRGTVSPEDATKMVSLTPTQRLEWLLSQQEMSDAHEGIELLLTSYDAFLKNTAFPEEALVDRFLDREQSSEYFSQAAYFGNQVFDVLEKIGKRSRFHRLLVV
jgi:predicted nucleotidyltransferase